MKKPKKKQKPRQEDPQKGTAKCHRCKKDVVGGILGLVAHYAKEHPEIDLTQ